MNMSTLTQKIGPLPAWVWGGLAAVGVWYFLIRGKAAPPSTANAAASGSQLSSGYGLGYAQGLQASQANQPSTSTSSSTSSNPLQRLVAGGSPTGLFADPSTSRQVTWVAANTSLQPAGAPVAGSYPFGATSGFWAQSNYWQPVTYQGQTLYVWAPFAQPAPGAGVGGPGTSRKHASGRRSAVLWSDAHPLVGARVRYPHYVTAVGGPGGHRAEVMRVAQQAGVHPARVAMLNPHPTGRIRIA